MKILILVSIFFPFLNLAWAQKINIDLKNKEKIQQETARIQKVTFADNKMNIAFKDGGMQYIEIDKIQKITHEIREDYFLCTFPNPAQNEVKCILRAEINEPATLFIYSTEGFLIHKENMGLVENGFFFTINLEDKIIKKGGYILILKGASFQAQSKIIIT
jgi:hypothetical protein